MDKSSLPEPGQKLWDALGGRPVCGPAPPCCPGSLPLGWQIPPGTAGVRPQPSKYKDFGIKI